MLQDKDEIKLKQTMNFLYDVTRNIFTHLTELTLEICNFYM